MLLVGYYVQITLQRASDDSASQLKKQVKIFLSKKGKSSETPLRISWNDLLNVSSKGRWWLVGSSWSGGSVAEKQIVAASSGAPPSSSVLHSFSETVIE